MGRGAQAMKRIPRIKFPEQRPKPSDSASQHKTTPAGSVPRTFFSGANKPTNTGGMASLQPKRTPLSQDEIESILLGGCI